ncbi:serine/threonine-protein kinase [Urbifossiella limnaea]|uniref:Serine/threonine-protein kinase PknA n=1 Tax=Urbifossiella limnaea TaxID=2528023 RepID=A0A517XVD3_9BACT|nr:serine/threonine-protein kinase [Urbifossiella limnaea]QDU21471.1 Serine/threonine-protein kinase PknA [Urbifossiella limnaea]
MKSARAREFQLPVTTRYEFEKLLGSGGMGVVYQALDRRTGERVAIKVLRFQPSANPTLFKRIEREFRSASNLEHPNIVRALAFETDERSCFLVYELINGGSLGDRLDNHGRIPEVDAVKLITQVAQALHYAHSFGVIHRDVKPDNVLILPSGRVKLTDFGLAKELDNDEELTRQASGLGTPNYMAPEQFVDARSAGVQCDVYSLAATLFHLLTGRIPFDGKTDLAILTMKERGIGTSPRALLPGISGRVDAAIRAALNPDATKRPATVLEFFKLLTARTRLGRPGAVPNLTQSAAPDDRRVSCRHTLKVGACGVVDTTLHGGTEEVWPLVVRDVSGTGIGVTLARRFEVGTELGIELHAGREPGLRRFAARVVRVQSDRGGYWVHGCVFDPPIHEDDVAGLLEFA